MEKANLIPEYEEMDCASKIKDNDDAVWRRLIISEHNETKWKIIACTSLLALAFTWIPMFILLR